MTSPALDATYMRDEAAALAYVEARLWPDGPVCPRCQRAGRVGRLAGKTTRAGLCKCYACKKSFTVRIGTILESSHVPLHLWLQLIHLAGADGNGVGTREIQRMLQCSMTTATSIGRRLRAAAALNDGAWLPKLRDLPLADRTELSGAAIDRLVAAPADEPGSFDFVAAQSNGVLPFDQAADEGQVERRARGTRSKLAGGKGADSSQLELPLFESAQPTK
jgi:transposase-like protein